MKRTTIFGIALMLSLSFILGACVPVAEIPIEAVVEEQEQAETMSEPITLKIAVLPIMDALPMFVAEADGLFESHGVNVDFIPVASAPERVQLIKAEQADPT